MDKTVFIQAQSGLQYDWKAIAADPSGVHQPQLDLVTFKALYTNKIAQARACDQEPVLVSLPVMDCDRYFAFITRGMTIQERKNLLFWLGGSTERLRNLHDLYNLALFRLASLQCVHIVDITSPMLAHPHYSDLLERDGITLSLQGQSLMTSECNKAKAHEAA